MAIDDFPPGGAAFDLGPVGDDQGATVPQAQQPAQAQAAQQPAQPQGIDPQHFMQLTTALIGQAGMAGENKPGWMQAVGHLTDAMKTHAEPEPPGEIWMAGHGDDIREFKSKAAFDQFNQTCRTAATKEQDTLGQYNKIITNRKLTLRDMAQQVRLLALQNDHGDIAAGAAGMSVDHVSKQVGDRMKAVQHLNTQADKIMQMADMQSKNGLMKKRDQLIQAVSSGRIPPGQEESVMTHIRSIGSALDQMAKAGGWEDDMKHRQAQAHLDYTLGQVKAQQQKGPAQPDGGAAGYSPAALEELAMKFNATGRLPGYTGANTPAAKAITNKAAELKPHQDLALQEARSTANKAALTGQTKIYHQVTAQEGTARAIAENVIKIGDRLNGSNVPVFNRWQIAGRRAVAGDPDVTEFDAQIRILKTEAARIVTQFGNSGVLSDSARQEFDQFAPESITRAQLAGLKRTLDFDFNARSEALTGDIGNIESAISGGQGTPSPAGGAGKATPGDHAFIDRLLGRK